MRHKTDHRRIVAIDTRNTIKSAWIYFYERFREAEKAIPRALLQFGKCAIRRAIVRSLSHGR